MALYDRSIDQLPVDTPIFTFAAQFAELQAELASRAAGPNSQLGAMTLEAYPSDTEIAIERTAEKLGEILGARDFNAHHGPREGHDPRPLDEFVKSAKISVANYLKQDTPNDGARSIIALYFDSATRPDFAPSALAEIQ